MNGRRGVGVLGGRRLAYGGATAPCTVRTLCLGFVLFVGGCAVPVVDSVDDATLSSAEDSLVLGVDDRQRVTQAMATTYPYRAVAAVRRSPLSATAVCTAFKVGPRHLLGAAHCFYGELANGTFGLIVGLESFRLVMGQYGTGNALANMPVDGRKLSLQHIYVPPEYVADRGASKVNDWVLLRLADGDSGPGWFRTKAWTDAEMKSFLSPTVSGYPGTSQVCAASPFATGQCSGYQYHGLAATLGLAASYVDVAADWTEGQSGGPLYGTVAGQAQRVALGIIHSSGGEEPRNFARRLTSTISTKVCQQLAAFPSTRFPNVPCTP